MVARVLGYFGLVGVFAAGIQVGVGDGLHRAFWDTSTSTRAVTLPGKTTPSATVTAPGKTVTTPGRTVVRRVSGKTQALPGRVVTRTVKLPGRTAAADETGAVAGATRTVTARGPTRTVAGTVRTVTQKTTQTVTVTTCAPPPHPTNPPCPPHK